MLQVVAGQNIVIGGTDENWCAALARALEAMLEAATITITPTAGQALAAALDGWADVVIVDGYPTGTSLRALADLTTVHPSVRVLVHGPLDPHIHALVAVASGATGYLPLDSAPPTVASAVEAMLHGDVVLPQAVTAQLVRHLRCSARGITVGTHDGRTTELTNREWEVLVQLRQDRGTDEIARRMVVSPGTVRSHVKALLDKLGEHSRAGLSPSAGVSE